MPLTKLWPGFAIGFLLFAAGCGGGSSSPAAPTAPPTAAPTPGAVALTFAVSPAPTPPASTTTIAFVAETQVATVTATQPNFSGTFTAALSSGCGTAATLGGTSPNFTVTAVSPISSGCTLTVTGGTGGSVSSSTASLGITIPAPGPLQLWWVANAALGSAVAGQTITPVPGPVNLIGITSTYGAAIVASKANYIGTFNAGTLSGACTGFVTATTTPSATISPTTLGTVSTLASAQAYYAVVGAAAIPTSGGCTLTVTDNAVNTNATYGTATIGVSVTTSTGGIQ